MPLLDAHVECGVRMIIGSISHMQGRCGCYVAGSQEEDPPDITLREAARLAYNYWFSLDRSAQFAAIARPRVTIQ